MNVTSLFELAGQVIRDWQRCAAEANGARDVPPSTRDLMVGAGDDGEDLRDVFDDAIGAGDAWLANVLAGGARRAPVASSSRILAEAFTMGASVDVVSSFARSASYDSVNPSIIGDYQHRPKCNVFVGDVLWSAGFHVPTYEIDGACGVVGHHYKEAERWPKETACFDRITSLDDVRPGDVMIVDYKDRHGSGGGAHAEIITRAQHDDTGLHLASMGARTLGLREDGFHADKLLRAVACGDHFDFPGDGRVLAADIYVLRPKRQRADGAA